MMRQLTCSAPTIRRLLARLETSPCHTVLLPVKVDWPELQLSEDQMLANALARIDGQEPPYPNQSLFHVAITRS